MPYIQRLFLLGLLLAPGFALTSAPANAQVWQPVGPDLDALDIGPHTLVFHPHGDQARFFVLGTTTLWQIDQDGESWRRFDPPAPRDSLFNFSPFSEALVVDPRDPERFTWFVHSRMLTTVDNGLTWSQFRVSDLSYFIEAHIDPQDPSHLFAVGYGSEDAYLFPTSYRSDDGGKTWSGWGPPGVFQHLLLRAAPDDPRRLYVGGNGLYRSTDRGKSWETLLDFDFDEFVHYVVDMAFGGADDQVLYVIANDKLLVSHDGGATFDLAAGATELELDLVEGDPRNAQVIYVRTTDDEILRSLDGGASFESMQLGLPTGVAIRDLQLEPRFGENLYALTADQLYRWRRDVNEVPRDCRACLPPPFAISAPTGPSPPRTTPRISTEPAAKPAQLDTASAAGVEIAASSPALLPRTSSWRALGPEGGPLYALTVCPSDNETVYAASRHHVFVSHDSAETWSLAGILPRGEVRELACDAESADFVYADTGYDGLWRGDNGGAVWVWLTNGLADPPSNTDVDVSALLPYVQRMAPHPTTGNVLYLAAGDLYRSLDAGSTWAALVPAPGVPDNPSQLPAGGFCQVVVSEVDGALLAQPCVLDAPLSQREYGVWRSDDDGATWRRLTSEPLGPRLFSDPFETDRVAVVGYTQPLLETFGGRRWYPRGSGLPAKRLHALAVNPGTPEVRLAAGYDQLWRSDNDGVSYSPVTDPDLDGRRLHDLRYAPGPTAEGTGPRAYLATDAGLLWTRGGGVQWTPKNSGLQSWPVSRLQAHPSVDGPLLLVAGGYGWRSLDSGASWQRLDEPSAGKTVSLTAAPSDPRILYVSGERGIWRSTNGGASWQATDEILSFGALVLAVDPDDPTHVYAAGLFGAEDAFRYGILYQSHDSGETWSFERVSNRDLTFHQVAFDPSQSGRLYVAGSGLHRREGAGWREITDWTSSSGPTVVDLAFDPTQPGVFYAATQEAGVLRGAALGNAEAPANLGLPAHPIRAVTIASDGTVYAGLDSGIYSSTDGGDSWQLVATGDGLSRGITALVTASDGTVYAGTDDHGLYAQSDN